MIAGVVAGGRPLAISETDPSWSSVVLMMHMDGANNSTAFTDEKGAPITTGGDTKISTAISKFGGSSCYFDGTGDYLFTPDATKWHLSGNFTIEAWLYPTSVSPAASFAIISQSTGGASEVTLGIGSDGKPFMRGTSTVVLATTPLVANVWQHYACVRSAGVVTHYIDGVACGSGTWGPTDQASGLYIGAYYYGGLLAGRYYPGYIDELRITKGVARYTSNFTPPGGPFPNS